MSELKQFLIRFVKAGFILGPKRRQEAVQKARPRKDEEKVKQVLNNKDVEAAYFMIEKA